MTKEQPTLESVIEGIFAKLAIRYGEVWARQWQSVDIKLVKADWAEELGGFSQNLEPLRYALRNLPERCPNVTEFKALANRCPPPEFKQLPAPRASEKVIAEQIAKQTGLKAVVTRHDDKEWARRLIGCYENGGCLRPISLLFARQALGLQA